MVHQGKKLEKNKKIIRQSCIVKKKISKSEGNVYDLDPDLDLDQFFPVRIQDLDPGPHQI